MSNHNTQTSKYLSYILRHRPDEIGLELDASGWADVDSLLVCAAEHGHEMSMELLEEVVATNDKQRFEFSEDHATIRARQGHSIKVELGYQPTVPPDVLYHGTADRNIESIKQQGLVKGQRHHVHLSGSQETAMKVGKRYGKPVLLTIASGRMHAEGLVFYRTGNNVWLTDRVPAEYIARPEEA